MRLDTVNDTDYTITVHKRVICQNEALQTADGKGCCAMFKLDVTDTLLKKCKCSDKNDVYIPETNQCGNRGTYSNG